MSKAPKKEGALDIFVVVDHEDVEIPQRRFAVLPSQIVHAADTFLKHLWPHDGGTN